MIRHQFWFAAALALCAHTGLAADPLKALLAPDAVQWGDTGPQFPTTQFAMLDGDPGKRGPVAFRWRCPDQFRIHAHVHPGAERVTVLQGAMMIGVGKKYDAAGLREVKAGGFFVIPAKEAHYGDCIGDTIIEVHTEGPLGTTFVNPADDPSKKK